MWTFYWDLVARFPGMLLGVVMSVEGAIAVIGFVVLLFNKRLGKKFIDWDGVSSRWAVVPIVLMFAYAILLDNYEQHKEAKDEALAARSDARRLANEVEQWKAIKGLDNTRIEELERAVLELSGQEPDGNRFVKAFDYSEGRTIVVFGVHKVPITDYEVRVDVINEQERDPMWVQAPCVLDNSTVKLTPSSISSSRSSHSHYSTRPNSGINRDLSFCISFLSFAKLVDCQFRKISETTGAECHEMLRQPD